MNTCPVCTSARTFTACSGEVEEWVSAYRWSNPINGTRVRYRKGKNVLISPLVRDVIGVFGASPLEVPGIPLWRY